MGGRAIQLHILFSCIGIITSERKGFVSKVFVEKKFDCPSSSKKVYTMKSEIQCAHHCLQIDNCGLLNCNTEKETQDNCEIFSKTERCTTKLGKKKWKAMRFLHKSPPIGKRKVYKSCKEIYNDDPSSVSGVYELETGRHYCLMANSAGSCGEGGWTLALTVDGTMSTFMADSAYWTNNQTYNTDNGIKSFSTEEAKFPAFSKIPFNDVCVGMNVSSDARWLLIPGINKESLLSIFVTGQALYTSLDRSLWMGLLASSVLQSNCNRQGFNVMKSSNSIIVRIGYIANNENSCYSIDSFIGIGPSISGISCGNHAAWVSLAHIGGRSTPAMCYVLIQ